MLHNYKHLRHRRGTEYGGNIRFLMSREYISRKEAEKIYPVKFIYKPPIGIIKDSWIINLCNTLGGNNVKSIYKHTRRGYGAYL